MAIRLSNIQSLGRYRNVETGKEYNVKKGYRKQRGTTLLFYTYSGKRTFISDADFYGEKWEKVDDINTYYITRYTEAHKWQVTRSKGKFTHGGVYIFWHKAKSVCKELNADIEAQRQAAKEDKGDGRGRPSLPEDQKAKRVFFTLRPEVWQAISPQGDAKELKTFAKEAINEKLKQEDKK